MNRFPKSFLFGTATSSFQVEGDNIYSDWWFWEQKGKIKDKSRSGKICDFWNKYEYYLDFAKDLGSNAFRFSLEWARINPQENTWNEQALNHYDKIIKAVKARDMKPIVTLWHFTLPQWLSEKNGWLNKDSLGYWQQYVEKINKYFGKEIEYWLTLNEPSIYCYKGFLEGTWPPGKTNIINAFRTLNKLIRAHRVAFSVLKQKDNLIGIALNLPSYEIKDPWCIFNILIAKILTHYSDWGFLKYIKESIDFVGINYYFHNRFLCNPIKPINFSGENTSDLGWGIYPRGIYEVTKKTYQICRKPIMITENGIADHKDQYRAQYIKDHIDWLLKATQEGTPVIGYLYWSLMDNFEWQEGKIPRFGLLEMNYQTLEAKPRESFEWYKRIIKSYRSIL